MTDADRITSLEADKRELVEALDDLLGASDAKDGKSLVACINHARATLTKHLTNGEQS